MPKTFILLWKSDSIGMDTFNIDTKNRLHDILRDMKKKVLVIGDLILDRYVETIPTRLAREAPIPISRIINEHSCAGGAGNLATNITSLGGHALVVGVIGNDYEGETLLNIFTRDKIDTTGILKIDRETSLHTRYYVDKSLHLRIDKDVTKDLDRTNTEKLFDNIKSIIKDDIDCICISDYDKGCITPRLLRYIIMLAKDKSIPVYGQPMVRHYLDFIGCTLVKSNIKEASTATGISILNESSLHNLGINLLTRLSAKYIILTTGKKGLTTFEENNIINIPSFIASESFRKVIGVRDAMTAMLSLALLAGADIVEASLLSNMVAATLTHSITTAVIEKEHLKSYIDRFDKKVITKVPLHR